MSIHLLSQDYLSLYNEIDFSVISGGYADLDTNWRSDVIVHPFTRVYFIESGLGHVHTEDETLELLPGNMYILPSGLRFSFSCPHRMDQIFLHVQMLRGQHDLFQQCRTPLVYPVDPAVPQQIKAWMSSKAPASPVKLKALMWQLLAPALEDSGILDRFEKKPTALIQEIVSFIQENLSAHLTVEDLAVRFNVSRSKLQRDFKSSLGVTPKEYIHTLLFIKAEHLLFNTSYSIKEISDQLGFCDQFYFSKCFMHKYGDSPLRYKHMHLDRRQGATRVIK